MSNTISAEEYRQMIGKKEHVSKTERTEPSVKSGKLDTVAALKAMGNYFELDAKSVNFFINQLRLNGKL
jgi:hypothetical protein